jgi:predicted chitinase
MSKKRVLAYLAAASVAIGGVAAAVIPMTVSNAAAACVTPYSAGTTYWGNDTASYNGHNWRAKWWSLGEAPSTGGTGVWADNGECGAGGGTTPPPGGGTTPPPGGGTSCNYPNWAQGTNYAVGAIVKYTNGQYYRAKNANPGYDPIISTWFWEPFTCTGGGGSTTPPPNNGGGGTTGFPISESQFNQMFPSRNSFYSYSGLTDAIKKYPTFTGTGDDTTKKREAAAFLANVNHETGGLVYVEEIAKGNYCDTSQPYGCPAGTGSYYGRGPIQLSWNFNYKAAGDALGIDLLNQPNLVATNSSISWQTGIWYWMTQNGPGPTTAHNAITGSGGFGGTIRSINGSLECDGRNPAQVQSRIDAYNRFVQILGVSAGSNVSC